MDDATFRTHERLRSFPPAQLIYIIYCRLVEHGARSVVLWLYDKIVRRVKGYSVPAISRVAPNLYVGGQHSHSGVSAMRELGITAVVNMREESDDRARGVALDHYLWVDTTDDTPPSLEELEKGARFIAQQIAAGRGVYIHCAAGVGRAPTMAAAYLIREGATATFAWDTIRAARPFIRPTPPQVKAIEAYERRHRGVGQGETALAARVERAFAQVSGDEGLTGDLTDEASRVLLDRARDDIEQLVAGTKGLPEEEAQEALAPKLLRLRRRLRQAGKASAEDASVEEGQDTP